MAKNSSRSETFDMGTIYLAYAGIGYRTTDRYKAYKSEEDLLTKL